MSRLKNLAPLAAGLTVAVAGFFTVKEYTDYYPHQDPPSVEAQRNELIGELVFSAPFVLLGAAGTLVRIRRSIKESKEAYLNSSTKEVSEALTVPEPA